MTKLFASEKFLDYVVLICLSSSTPCLAENASSEFIPPLPNNLPQPTPVKEVTAGNPIKLEISELAPSADLPKITGPLDISKAIELGLSNNLTYRQSSFDVQMARYKARKELGRFGPTISANPFYSTSSLNQMLFNPITEGYGAGWPMQPIERGTLFSMIVAGTQPLFTGGFLRGNYKAARANERQSIAGLQLEKISTALRIKQAYWSALYNEDKLQVDVDYVKFRQESSSNMKAKWETGKVPRADYLRELAELSRARAQVAQDYREFNVALVNLKVELGISFTSLIDLADSLEKNIENDDLNKYLMKAGVERPEIARAESKILEMRGRQMVARSEYLPHLNAYGVVSNLTGNSPDGRAYGNWGGFIGLIGHMTLFDSAQGINDIKSANAALRQAFVAKQQAKQKVAQDVITAWIDRETSRQKVDLAKTEIVSAEEDYRLLHERYIVGKSIPLEEFDAAVKLFRSKLGLVEALYNFRLAQDKLVYASGSY